MLDWIWRFFTELKLTDVLIAGFTGLLWWSTDKLWGETKKLAEGADDQARKMAESIAEAARAASAMERVATAMTTNVERVRESVAISREIADKQKQVGELQSRAYLGITHRFCVAQTEAGLRFQPNVALINLGNTPAYNVKFSTAADVLPYPLRDNFEFPLPSQTQSSSFIGPRLEKLLTAVVPKMYPQVEEWQIKSGVGQRVYIWGHVTYDDAFGVTRYVKFAQSVFWMEDGKSTMSEDTARHNDAD